MLVLSGASAVAAGNMNNWSGKQGSTSNSASTKNGRTYRSTMMHRKAPEKVALANLDNAKEQIGEASVEDASGAMVGHVTSVETAKNGQVQGVKVALNSGKKVVAILVRDLTYDRGTNTVDARLTRSRIDSMPGASR